MNKNPEQIARDKTLLIEGKEPPLCRKIGEAIGLTMLASALVPEFRQFIK